MQFTRKRYLFASLVAALVFITAPACVLTPTSAHANNAISAESQYNVKESSYSFISAKLNSNSVSLEINLSQEDINSIANRSYPQKNIIPIPNSRKLYKGIYVGPVNIDWWPQIFLLRHDGKVDYIDVLNCIMQGKDISVNNTINRLEDIRQFALVDIPDDMRGSIPVTHAIDKYGNRHRMDWYLFFTRSPELAPPKPEDAINLLFTMPASMAIINKAELPEVSLSTDGIIEVTFEGDTKYCMYVKLHETHATHAVTLEHFAVAGDNTIYHLDIINDKWIPILTPVG